MLVLYLAYDLIYKLNLQDMQAGSAIYFFIVNWHNGNYRSTSILIQLGKLPGHENLNIQ